MHDCGEGNPGAQGYRGLESGKRRQFPYWGMAPGLVDQSNSPGCLAFSLEGSSKGLGGCPQRQQVGSGRDDEALVTLINTQNHKNCDVMGLSGNGWASS